MKGGGEKKEGRCAHKRTRDKVMLRQGAEKKRKKARPIIPKKRWGKK